MSEFYTHVVEIEKVQHHPNADRLDICTVLSSYPVITKRDEYKVGDKAVYIAVDALVPLADDRWSFLRDSKHPDKTHHKIKAVKLRQVFSMGILTPADPTWQVGDNVGELLNIKKYEPEERLHLHSDSEPDPGFIPIYTDIEGFRKYPDMFEEGEQVVCLEKLHGCNLRICWSTVRNRLYVGSHRQIKKDVPNSIWWEVLRRNGYYRDHEGLNAFNMWPNMVFFGELYGQVQDLTYGVAKGEVKLAIFDIYSIDEYRYVDWKEVQFICQCAALETVPVLYQGPWNKSLTSLAEGTTTISGASHTREGFVIKPLEEQVNHLGHRKILKFVGEGYLTRKE
jgi:RNA ligase (TIGR02306 family)